MKLIFLHIASLICLSVLGNGPWIIKVRDAATSKPVERATIHAGRVHLVCDANGEARLFTYEALLKVGAIGYKLADVSVSPDQYMLEINLEPEVTALDNVVVSGNLRPMTRLSSPIAVESYNQQFLKRNPTPNLFEAMTVMNGVQPTMACNVCNTGDIRINGMEGPYTMVLIDGMPIVSSLSTVYGLMGIPNSIIQRIEVVKGPASTLYGSEAVGGLINIITKSPANAPKASADISLTTRNEWNADITAKLTGHQSSGFIALNAFRYWTPHDVNRDNFTDVTQQERLSLFGKWDWDRRDDLPASVAMRLFTENRWGGELQWTPQWRGSNMYYGESIKTNRAELIGRYGLHKNLLLEYSYNFHHQDSYYGTTPFMAKQHTVFGQLRWNQKIGKHFLLAGLPFRYLSYDDNTSATAKPGGNAPGIQTNLSLFMQDEIAFNPQWTLLAGLRYEHSNMQGGVMAPRLAVKFQPEEHHTLRLSAGNGFRIVNLFTEDHAAISGFREVVIKNDLKPERSWNISTSYSGDAHASHGVFAWDASLFFTRFSNKIIPDYITDPAKIIYDNIDGFAVSKGVAATLDYISNNGIRASAGVTYMDVFTAAANGIQTRQMYAPEWSGNYSLSIPLRKIQTTIDITGKWTGPMRLPVVPNDFRPTFSPAYNLSNIQVSKKWKHDIETYVAIKNLFNFMPLNPILHPDDPFDRPGGPYWNTDGSPNSGTNPHGYMFDPTYNYAPMQGIKAMFGVRCTIR